MWPRARIGCAAPIRDLPRRLTPAARCRCAAGRTGFAQLLSAIVSQQVSVASAAAIWARLQAAGMVTPEAIRAVDESALRDLGLSRQKAAYAGALAAAEIDFAALRRMPDAEVIATLVAVRGIGIWTAEIYAMFSLGRADVFAPGDLALQESAAAAVRPGGPAEGARAAADGRSLVALAVGCGPCALGLLQACQGKGRYSMTRVLTSGRKEPASGELRSVVIFLHGYGANGADLLGLADPLSEHLPDTLFLAPDEPEACAGAPMGFQWFPIPWIDGSSQEEAEAGMVRAAEDLNAYLDSVMVDEDVLPEQVALFGFSQAR